MRAHLISSLILAGAVAGAYAADSGLDPAQPVQIQQRVAEDGSQILWARNRFDAPAEVEIEVRQLDNLSAEPSLPNRFVVPPLAEQVLVTLRMQDNSRDGALRYVYRALLGDPHAQPDLDYPYRPPLAPGTQRRISQAFFGDDTHSGLQNRYAVDIGMSPNTPVHAARAGKVIAVEQSYQIGGNRPELSERANYVRVLHDDGTMAVYGHLRPNGARVTVGQAVEAGQALAWSGNTGYSSAPHLHFVIQRNSGMQLESLPFVFAQPDGSRVAPQHGMHLQVP